MVSRSDSQYFCFQALLPKHLLLKDLVSKQSNDLFKRSIKMHLFLHVLINHRRTCLPVMLLMNPEHSVSPHEQVQLQAGAMPVDISVDL